MPQETEKLNLLFRGLYKPGEVAIGDGNYLRTCFLYSKGGGLFAETTCESPEEQTLFTPPVIAIKKRIISLVSGETSYEEVTKETPYNHALVSRYRKIVGDNGTKIVDEIYNLRTGLTSERDVEKRKPFSETHFRGTFQFSCIDSGRLNFAEINVCRSLDGKCVGYLNLKPTNTENGKPYTIIKLDIDPETGARTVSNKSIAKLLRQR